LVFLPFYKDVAQGHAEMTTERYSHLFLIFDGGISPHPLTSLISRPCLAQASTW